jgi:hypothetical protein
MSEEVKFQLNEGQKVRGIKSKSFMTSKEQAEKWQDIGIGVIIVDPDPFANLVEDKQKDEPKDIDLVDELLKNEPEIKPVKKTKKGKK